MDRYDHNRIKEMTQTSKGISSRRIFRSNEGQTMTPNTNDWDNFLNKGENKTEVINSFLRYFRSRFKLKLLFTESTNTWKITPSAINMLFTCNHHKTNTRIALRLSKSKKPVIITAAETDVLVLLTHMYPQCNNAKQWLMKTNLGIFIDIKTICNFFGNGICQILPRFHSINGCDTTSYPFGVGKINLLKKMRRLSKMHLLQDVRKNIDSFKSLSKPKLFFQRISYSGKENKTFVSTWKRLYENQKYKNSSRLIPDTHSTHDHLKRADLQTFIWRQCMGNIIEYPHPIDRGW